MAGLAGTFGAGTLGTTGMTGTLGLTTTQASSPQMPSVFSRRKNMQGARKTVTIQAWIKEVDNPPPQGQTRAYTYYNRANGNMALNFLHQALTNGTSFFRQLFDPGNPMHQFLLNNGVPTTGNFQLSQEPRNDVETRNNVILRTHYYIRVTFQVDSTTRVSTIINIIMREYMRLAIHPMRVYPTRHGGPPDNGEAIDHPLFEIYFKDISAYNALRGTNSDLREFSNEYWRRRSGWDILLQSLMEAANSNNNNEANSSANDARREMLNRIPKGSPRDPRGPRSPRSPRGPPPSA